MICAVVALAPACTQDFDDSVNNVPMKTITLSASYELPEVFAEDGTRVTLNAKDQLVWEAGDAITIVYNGDQKAVSTALSEDDEAVGQTISESATFSVEIPEDATINYAMYFALKDGDSQALNSFSGTALRPNFSGVGVDDKGNLTYLSMYGNNLAVGKTLGSVIRQTVATGKVSYNPSSQNASVTLHNTTAFAEVQLTGSEKVWSVDLLSKSQALRSRWATISNITSDNPKLSIYQTNQDKSEDPSPMGGAHYPVSGGVQLSDTPTSFYFAMPVVDLPAKDMFILVRCDKFSRLYRSKKAHSFTRNHVTRFAPIQAVSTNDDYDYEPLDANGVSNCYMVAPATTDKYYSFSIQNIDGTSKVWNGSTKNYGAWHLWATKDGLVEDVQVVYGASPATGRILFKVPANCGKGSCMIAAGPLGSIQSGTNWAWHIWITDAEDMTYTNDDITVLDRNPGALWVPKSTAEVESMTGETAAQTVGFMYQYGRAIPFPGPAELAKLSGTDKYGYEKITNNDSNEAKGRFSNNTQHVEYYRFTRWQHAFTVYGLPKTSSNKNNWKSIAGNYKYGEINCSAGYFYQMQFLQYGGTWAMDLTQDYVGTSGRDELWAIDKKGNQDPCPQGYRVATYKELVKLFRRVSDDPMSSSQLNPVYLKSYSPSTKTWINNDTGCVDAYGATLRGSDDAMANVKENFVWLPYGGMRTSYKDDPQAKQVANTYYAGAWDSDGNGVVDSSGEAYVWGTIDCLTDKMKNATKNYKPGHNLTEYPNNVKVPAIWATGKSNVWNIEAVSTAMNATHAMPVRCVKLATANGEAQVASLAGQQNDTNTWK